MYDDHPCAFVCLNDPTLIDIAAPSPSPVPFHDKYNTQRLKSHHTNPTTVATTTTRTIICCFLPHVTHAIPNPRTQNSQLLPTLHGRPLTSHRPPLTRLRRIERPALLSSCQPMLPPSKTKLIARNTPTPLTPTPSPPTETSCPPATPAL